MGDPFRELIDFAGDAWIRQPESLNSREARRAGGE